jgi:hypothetical protein
MKPQHQTQFGTGKNGEPHGNCFATALACILELPVEEVPNFCETDDWRLRVDAWLAQFGLFYMDIELKDGLTAPEVFAAAGYHVISGDGPRGCRHSVVGRAGCFVHDPHPSGEGLLTKEEFGFLVPLDYKFVMGSKR